MAPRSSGGCCSLGRRRAARDDHAGLLASAGMVVVVAAEAPRRRGRRPADRRLRAGAGRADDAVAGRPQRAGPQRHRRLAGHNDRLQRVRPRPPAGRRARGRDVAAARRSCRSSRRPLRSPCSPASPPSPEKEDCLRRTTHDTFPLMSLTEPYGELATWEPAAPRLRPWRLLIGWIVAAASVWLAAWILPGLDARPHRRRVPGRRPGRRAQRGAAADPRRAAPAVHGRHRLPPRPARRRPALLLAADALPTDIHVDAFGDALLGRAR